MTREDYLNRYTSLPVLLDILRRKTITLLDPQSWEDRNDSFCIEKYKNRKKYTTVLGLCFSAARETFHHWKVFSSGVSGVCIEFDKTKLLRSLPRQKGFRHGPVEYWTLRKLEGQSVALETVPFLKRWAYRDEKEYRIIYENSQEELQTMEITIGIDCIRKVTLSPWLPKSVYETVSDVIRLLPGCRSVSINRSTLIENSRWKKAISDGCLMATPRKK
jgi:hypothetical protein